MESVGGIGRVIALGAIIGAIVLVIIVLLGVGGGYEVTAQFQNSSQLVKGNLVQVGGNPIGDGQGHRADARTGRPQIELEITDGDYVASPRGHHRDHPPVLALGDREPLRRPESPDGG